MSTSSPHIPVLLNEVLEAFKGHPIHHFIDGTTGAGGHARALLEAHPEIERWIGIDRDPTALKLAQERLQPWMDKVSLIHGNYSDLNQLLEQTPIQKVDGILVDLGVSSMQFDQPERGFSFREDGPLDMRMDPSQTLTAEEILNTWNEKELSHIFRDYGEETRWRASARTIVAARDKDPIQSTQQLVDLLHPLLAPAYRHKRIHPLTQIFQALRIAVNAELSGLETFLPQAVARLQPGGLLAVISFHSLEDRIVKHFFQQQASDKVSTSGVAGVFIDKDPIVDIVTRKPLTASESEVAQNPRSRSAKLRVIRKRS